MVILGISAFYHDSSAALIRDGVIIAAAQEERFKRKKHDSAFPTHASEYCLKEAGVTWNEVDAVVFYDKPWLKFERILETYYALAPRGAASFHAGLPVWLKEKALLPRLLRKHIPKNVPLKFSQHHLSHAASAFFPSPFASAAVLTLDGVGEWATATIAHGQGRDLKIIREMSFPHSVGLLYSAFTQFCGFKVNSGEYKLMGLAPYGEPKFVREIHEHLIDVKPDGSFWLNLDYFDFLRSFRMANGRFHSLFGGPPREPEAPVDQRHMDVARSIQVVTQEIMLKLARHAREVTGLPNLCMAGGVALNCVANGRLLREGPFADVWVQRFVRVLATGEAENQSRAEDVARGELGGRREAVRNGVVLGHPRVGRERLRRAARGAQRLC